VSYLQYINISGRAVRNSLKEPFRSDAILKTDLYRWTKITFGPKLAPIPHVQTNYKDAERARLETYVVDNKKVLQPDEGKVKRKK